MFTYHLCTQLYNLLIICFLLSEIEEIYSGLTLPSDLDPSLIPEMIGAG